MVRNREEAVKASLQTLTNQVGMCQNVTRNWFGVPAVGDFDGDGSADAEDGWKSEPRSARHVYDRNPPRGVPVTFSGGSHDNWHRAISHGNGVIRSTDMSSTGYWPGHVSNTTIDRIEQSMGLQYRGWSETCDGVLIPLPSAPELTLVAQFLLGGPRYDLRLLDRAVLNGRTGKVKDVRDEIVHQVNRLRHVHPGPRINLFLQAFDSNHILKMRLLSEAIKAGRVYTVKDVRAKIMVQIHALPPA